MAYMTEAELKALGIASTWTSAERTALISWCQYYIEQVTGLWFEKRTLASHPINGSGTPILELPAPPITITAIVVDGKTVESTSYVTYNRRPEVDPNADDYRYPRLKLKRGADDDRLARSLWGMYGGPRRWRDPVWSWGDLNVLLSGDFGWTDGGSPPKTPLIILQALERLCAANATRVRDLITAGDRFQIQSEDLGSYSYSLFPDAISSTSAITSDQFVDEVLAYHSRHRALRSLRVS